MQWSGPSAIISSLKANKYLLVGGLVLAALPIGYAATSGSKANRFITAALADPLAILEGRSPGVRPSGALAQSKPRKPVPLGAAKPSERVLANVRTRPIVPAVMTVDGTQGPFAPVPALFDPTAPAQNALASTSEPAPIVNAGNGGGGLLPNVPGGFVAGGGAPATGAAGGIPATPAPVTPVPEPQTWVMMILGFLMVGQSLRSRPRARVEENEPKQNA